MRHKLDDTKLGRRPAHRKAVVAALVCGLVMRKRIRTTRVKARVARRLAEKMVTLARAGTLTARRRALATLRSEAAVAELFEKIAPHYAQRPGGYTRILKLGPRIGDGSEMVLLEWLDIALPAKPKKKAAAKEPGQNQP